MDVERILRKNFRVEIGRWLKNIGENVIFPLSKIKNLQKINQKRNRGKIF